MPTPTDHDQYMRERARSTFQTVHQLLGTSPAYREAWEAEAAAVRAEAAGLTDTVLSKAARDIRAMFGGDEPETPETGR